LDDRPLDRPQEVGRMHAGQSALAPPDRAPHRFDDHDVTHEPPAFFARSLRRRVPAPRTFACWRAAPLAPPPLSFARSAGYRCRPRSRYARVAVMIPIVLVHGGGLDARCWDPTRALLSAPSIAVDLPGRGAHPADLRLVTFADC